MGVRNVTVWKFQEFPLTNILQKFREINLLSTIMDFSNGTCFHEKN